MYKEHPEFYANATEKRKASLAVTIAARKAKKQLMKVPTVRMHLESQINGAAPKEMTAKELFSKLKEQQSFLNNIVSLVDQMIRQHEGGK